jgi:hypothetical protein
METVDVSLAKLDNNLGYYYLRIKGHPLADNRGKFYLHRYLASIKIGRWLDTKEHVDHINGIKTDNRSENLQILSTSEHGRKTMSDRLGGFKPTLTKICLNCSLTYETLDVDQMYCCKTCAALARRKFKVDDVYLHKLVWQIPTTKVAEIFGVSDVAIHKRLKRSGFSKPPRGYWAKLKFNKIGRCTHTVLLTP